MPIASTHLVIITPPPTALGSGLSSSLSPERQREVRRGLVVTSVSRFYPARNRRHGGDVWCGVREDRLGILEGEFRRVVGARLVAFRNSFIRCCWSTGGYVRRKIGLCEQSKEPKAYQGQGLLDSLSPYYQLLAVTNSSGHNTFVLADSYSYLLPPSQLCLR